MTQPVLNDFAPGNHRMVSSLPTATGSDSVPNHGLVRYGAESQPAALTRRRRSRQWRARSVAVERTSRSRLECLSLLALLCLSMSAASVSAADDPVQLAIDSPYLHTTPNDRGDEVRWLSVFVTVTNHSNTELKIPPSAWQLRDSKATHQPAPITEAFEWPEIIDGDNQTTLASITPRELSIPVGKHERIGLFFQPLMIDLRRPDLTLTLTVAGQRLATLDIDQAASDSLQVNARRIGPARAVGLLQLSGELNSLNASRLVREFDELAVDQRVLRFVVELAAETRIPDQDVMHWLRQVAGQTGLGEIYNDRFAALPSDILAVHLTETAAAKAGQQRPDRLLAEHYDHVHENLDEAVEAALIPLCERLPRDLLLREFREGEAVSQRAMLRHSGERLLDADLPLILGFLQTDQAELRLAALETLRHFESQPAIDALTTAAASDDEKTSLAALASMATSRFGSVRDRLLALVQTSNGPLRQRVAQTLALYPHADWAPRLLELARDSDPDIRRPALSGLIALRHPQLDQLLRDGLRSDDAAIRNLSLQSLMVSREPENERLAADTVIADLATKPPSRATATFLQRVRDPRALPLLRKWLDSEEPRVRRRVVETLLTTGDQSVLNELAARFSSLGAVEQADILNSLFNASSPDFWTLAPQALQSRRARLFEATLELLRRDGSDRAVTLLASPLDDDAFAASQRSLSVCQTLAAIATPTARDVLIRQTKAEPATLRSASTAALQQLYARSPAMPFLMRGSALLDQANNPTLAMLHFNLAVEADPEHPPSRIARADIALKAADPSPAELEAARDDLRSAIRFDPSSPFALTCLGLTEVRLGVVADGIRLVEDERERFVGDALYHYNTACIYGRAIEALEAQLESQSPQAEELRTTIERYRIQAVSDLRQSIDNGLDEHNRNWMREDPDLATVRQSPDFEKLFNATKPPSSPDDLK